MKYPNPFGMYECDDETVCFDFALDEVTARRFGIRPKVHLRLKPDTGGSTSEIHFDWQDGGKGESFDAYYVEPYTGMGLEIADKPGEVLLAMLKRATTKPHDRPLAPTPEVL